jgi:hypothetical protein
MGFDADFFGLPVNFAQILRDIQPKEIHWSEFVNLTSVFQANQKDCIGINGHRLSSLRLEEEEGLSEKSSFAFAIFNDSSIDEHGISENRAERCAGESPISILHRIPIFGPHCTELNDGESRITFEPD